MGLQDTNKRGRGEKKRQAERKKKDGESMDIGAVALSGEDVPVPESDDETWIFGVSS